MALPSRVQSRGCRVQIWVMVASADADSAQTPSAFMAVNAVGSQVKLQLLYTSRHGGDELGHYLYEVSLAGFSVSPETMGWFL